MGKSADRIQSSLARATASRASLKTAGTLICFSHLRWDFVFQRPQHLMVRFARTRSVIFFEEPICDATVPVLQLRSCEASGVLIATPHLPEGMCRSASEAALRSLLDELIDEQEITRPLVWYYTPSMYCFSRHIDAAAVVYDCMDELANFRFASPELPRLERNLMAKADVMFTGGYTLFEAKRAHHPNVHPFPSSVDRKHFGRARDAMLEAPADQADIPHPRLGFFGVVDERLDLDLIAALADARPAWHLVIVGPVVKISPEDLPRRANIHYLGGKSYSELPNYLGGWDVAMMPFAINEATRFISPTKTPEYLAGGKPVVSTPITDVVRHYGALAGVKFGQCAQSFIAACEEALALKTSDWREEADRALADLSWDVTQDRMSALVDEAVRSRKASRAMPTRLPAPAIRPAGRKSHFDYLIVGAGFAGSVLAERLAAGSGKRVLLIDRRPHIGGNAYDHHDEAGILVHKYGPHIFHTNSDRIFNYLSHFTHWRPYEHRVLASTAEKLVPIPINRTTLNLVYGLNLHSDAEAEAFLKSRAEPREIHTSEDVVISAVGRELYERFFRGYTRKQWGLDPSQLDKSVTSRVPTRTNADDRYFGDEFQCMPLNGFTRMFENMLDHRNISIELGADFDELRHDAIYDNLIYTGPIDAYFGYRYGKLPYRCLSFDHKTLDRRQFQSVAVVNYPDENVPYTRITEYKHLTGQVHDKTSITYEYPSGEGDPYYPVPRAENQALYKQYEALTAQHPNVTFVGRLATYRYYNMDQVVGQALATYRKLAEQARIPVSTARSRAARAETGENSAAMPAE